MSSVAKNYISLPASQPSDKSTQPQAQTRWGKHKVTKLSVVAGVAIGVGIAAIVAFLLAAPIGLVALSIIAKVGILGVGGMLGGTTGYAISAWYVNRKCTETEDKESLLAKEIGKDSFIRMVSPIMNQHTEKAQRSMEEVIGLCQEVSRIDPTLLERLGALSLAQRESLKSTFSDYIHRNYINDHSTPYNICCTVSTLILQSVSPAQN